MGIISLFDRVLSSACLLNFISTRWSCRGVFFFFLSDVLVLKGKVLTEMLVIIDDEEKIMY